MTTISCNIINFNDCCYKNKSLVGGKCSSLGELYHLSNQIGFNIADGFAITTALYDNFISYNKIDNIIEEKLTNVDVNDIKGLESIAEELKTLITHAELSQEHTEIISSSYQNLCDKYNTNNLAVAIRSSAVAEDLDNASFAGQQDTYLNIRGDADLLIAVKKCFASLFNTRAISYRKTYNIQLSEVKIAVAVQKMVRSDIGAAGVAFSIDPETGYNKAIVINSAFGLGELVVSGGVKPDEFILDKRVLNHNDNFCDPIITKTKGDKFTKIIYNDNSGVDEVETTTIEKNNYSLTNNQIKMLGKFVLELEQRYSLMFNKKLGVDVEWALDGVDNSIYIIQTRPETIHSNSNKLEIKKYSLNETKTKLLIRGVAVGDRISNGKVKVLKNIDEYESFEKGDILVTEMTTPDWEPLMKIASGIITNKGGRTCHAAIIARELQLNAIVGTCDATKTLTNGDIVTISCAEGEIGNVYEGKLDYNIQHITVNNELKLPTKLMLNVGNPENSFNSSIIPNSGVGLARLEFIISNYIKIHPSALYNYPNLRPDIKNAITEILGTPTFKSDTSDDMVTIYNSYYNGKDYFIKQLSRSVAKIASAFYPNDVIIRLSDFKSNEYKNLIGGDLYEPNEENPMIGWRGASRYYSEEYKNAFALECEAIKYARETMKMTNIVVMIPFCRTPLECELVLEEMNKNGLTRGENGLQIYLMCEIPSNVIEADNFSKFVDGVSIGGNDLLQLVLGVDRDSEKIAYLSDNKNVSYRRMISMAIKEYKNNGVKVGFCGQQPSDSLEFCNFLINEGIDSISVIPDSAIKTINNLGYL